MQEEVSAETLLPNELWHTILAYCLTTNEKGRPLANPNQRSCSVQWATTMQVCKTWKSLTWALTPRLWRLNMPKDYLHFLRDQVEARQTLKSLLVPRSASDFDLHSLLEPPFAIEKLRIQSNVTVSNYGLKSLTSLASSLRELELWFVSKLSDECLSSLSALTSLTSLELIGQQEITCKNFPSSLSRLQRIKLNQTDYESEGLTALASLAGSLTSLSLSSTQRKQHVDHAPLALFTRLEKFSIANSTIELSDLSRLSPTIRHLTTNRCHNLSLISFREFTNLHSLTTLKMNHISINDEGFKSICMNLSQLELLKLHQSALSSIAVSDTGVSFLTHLKRLKKLKLVGFHQTTGTGFTDLHQNCPLLHTLALVGVQLSRKGCNAISQLTSLERLHLKFTGSKTSLEDLMAFSPLTKLQSLYVGYWKAPQVDFNWLPAFPSLSTLELPSNNLTDECFVEWPNLPSLTKLVLSYSPSITQEGVKMLAAKVPALTSLDLTGADVSLEDIQSLFPLAHISGINP